MKLIFVWNFSENSVIDPLEIFHVLGTISPNPFSVVIRTIKYDASNKYLSFQVGSGIIWYSTPEKEWDECMLKAEAIQKILNCY